MFVFLLVVLGLAALLEFLSLRGGADCAEVAIKLRETRAEPGEALELSTTVKNAGRLPISYLCVSVAFPLCAILPDGLTVRKELHNLSLLDVYRLWQHQKVTRTMSFSIEKRGVHLIRGQEVRRGDFLGLHSSGAYLSQSRDVLIFPERFENPAILEALGNYFGEQSARRWLLRDPILTSGVREYTGTEPMRTILWSQTARRGELMVREFDYSRSLNCDVILCVNGLRPAETHLLDTCCSIARTICEALAERNVEIRFYTNAELSGLSREPWRSCKAADGKMEDVLELLARVNFLACSPAELLASACLSAGRETAAYVVIVPRQSEQTDCLTDEICLRTGQQPLLIEAETWEVKPDAGTAETPV